ELLKEGPAVLGVRPAVDLEDQWALARGVMAGRPHQPALDLKAVGGHELVALRDGDEPLSQPGVGVRETPLPALVEDDDVAGDGRIRDAGDDSAGVDVEAVDRTLPGRDFDADLALEVDGAQLHDAAAAGLEEEAVSRPRPEQPRHVSHPHV